MNEERVVESNCGQTVDDSDLLSIVVPVFNEEYSIGIFLDTIVPVLMAMRPLIGPCGAAEIVFVDDGSTDRSVERIGEGQIDGVKIRLVKLSRNFGKDAALAAGLRHARGAAIIPMDVDLQDPPELLPDLVKAWREGAMVVNAARIDRTADSWWKRTTSRTFYKVYNCIASHPLESDVGDFRLLDREVVDVLNRMPERIRFMKGLFSWVGFPTARVEYRRDARAAGETKWRYWSLWNFALDGITGSTTLPLRIWTYFGCAMGALALIYAVSTVIRTVVFGVETPGYASLMVVVLTLGAANMITLGVIGEYVGRIAIEVRQRPLYVVQEVYEVN